MRHDDTIRHGFAAFGFMLLMLSIVAHFVECTPQTEEARYTTSLLRCVDKSDTLAESKACRQRIDGEFGVNVKVKKDAAR